MAAIVRASSDTPEAEARVNTNGLAIAAFASFGAGAIHAVAIGVHSQHRQAALAFAAAAVFQIGWGAVALMRPNRVVAVVGAVGNAGLLGGWIVAKTSGISFIDGFETAENVARGDLIAAGLALLAVLAASAALVSGLQRSPNLPSLVAVGVVVVALTVPGMDAVGSLGSGGTSAAGGHHGGAGGASAATAQPVVAETPFAPDKPIDLGGVPGVTPAQQARAENLLATTLSHLPKYAKTATAEADGFQTINDGGTGYEHYVNRDYMSDGKVLDPDRPESLVYQVRGGSKQIVAAMYMAEPGTTLDTTPDIGGALTQWHIHDNLCFTPNGGVAGLTTAEGTCAPPLVKPEAVPMIHVWIVPNPCGPFASLQGIAGGSIKPGEERLCDTKNGAG